MSVLAVFSLDDVGVLQETLASFFMEPNTYQESEKLKEDPEPN